LKKNKDQLKNVNCILKKKTITTEKLYPIHYKLKIIFIVEENLNPIIKPYLMGLYPGIHIEV